ncbi:MAG TPA: winged helix-turn-helix domain-containing protein, partial [Pseudomonadota bacterium]|nr:winged helix-turn-helix domain-containing protein [Pseudomonadota bacterium]
MLSDGKIWKTSDLELAVIDSLRLSAAQRALTLNSGQSQVYNRMGWALSALTRAKAVAKVRNGESQITDFGMKMLQDYPVEITEAGLKEIPAYQEYVPTKRAQTPVTVGTDQLPSYWFAGACFDSVDDQTERFLADGCWVNGNKGKYLDVVR